MTTAPFLQRHLGDYLLVAQLGEDALGTVFRALYAADERRFVRLRILQAEELSPALIERAIRADDGQNDPPPHDAIVSRPQLDLVDGIPFMTWDETAGWTLDTMLARVRAFGIRIPAEYALLITERLASALEHACQSAPGRQGVHGLLWPGFISISHDAAVRVGGFGIGPAVFPSLGKARMTAEIAPYLAPEVRAGGPTGPAADVYSLGAILGELLTGRRPSLDASTAQLRAGDPRSEELGAFLRRCLGTPDERFASPVEAHRALQQLLTGNPFSLYSANLSLFLYKLLNPESQSVAPSSDWESTNPIVIQAPPRREAVAPEPMALEPEPPALAPEPAFSAPVEAPLPVQQFAADLLVGRRDSRARELMARAWSRPAAALAAAASIAVGAFLIASRIQAIRGGVSIAPTAREMAVAPAQAAPLPVFPVPDSAPLPVAVATAAVAAPAAPAGKLEPASNRARPTRKVVKTEARQPAEELRLRAALARIEADRVNARETEGALFGEGRESEQEGERLLRQRDYDAAQMAFSRAARLFQRAQELTWEERLRQSDLSAAR